MQEVEKKAVEKKGLTTIILAAIVATFEFLASAGTKPVEQIIKDAFPNIAISIILGLIVEIFFNLDIRFTNEYYDYITKISNTDHRIRKITERLVDLWNTSKKDALFKEIINAKINSLDASIEESRIKCNEIEMYQIEAKIRESLKHSIKGESFLVFNGDYYDVWKRLESWYLQEVRKVAGESRVPIHRVYLCKIKTLHEKPDLIQQIVEDIEHDINVHLLLEEKLLNTPFEDKLSGLDMGLWNDQILSLVEKKHVVIPYLEASYSLLDEDKQEFHELKSSLLNQSTESKTGIKNELAKYEINFTPSNVEAAEETLDIVKELRNEKATQDIAKLGSENLRTISKSSTVKKIFENSKWTYECATNNRYMGGACDWFHSSWPYLRILEMVVNPDSHIEGGDENFYDKYLSNFFNEYHHDHDEINILICGVADHTMLRRVVDNIDKSAPFTVNIDIVDYCKTPIKMCYNYAKRHKLLLDSPAKDNKINCRLHKGDILYFNKMEDDKEQKKYHLIVTDAFLNRVSIDERENLLAKWTELLCIGGRIITTIRLIDEKSDENNSVIGKLYDSEPEQEAFTNKVWKCAPYRSSVPA